MQNRAEMSVMSEQKTKLAKPSVEELCTKYNHDEILKFGTERLFEIAQEYNMKNRWISGLSYTFTYRGQNV